MRVEVGVFEVKVAVVPGERSGVIYVGLADLVSIRNALHGLGSKSRRQLVSKRFPIRLVPTVA